MDQYKRCTGCGIDKPLSHFSARRGRPGPQAKCKPCVASYSRSRYASTGYDAAKARARYHANRVKAVARSAAWAAANPEKRREYKMRRRVLTGRFAPIAAEAIRERIAYFGGKCWMCGDAGPTLDHVKPVSKDGPHLLANLRPSCLSCNSAKRDKWDGPHRLAQFKRARTQT